MHKEHDWTFPQAGKLIKQNGFENVVELFIPHGPKRTKSTQRVISVFSLILRDRQIAKFDRIVEQADVYPQYSELPMNVNQAWLALNSYRTAFNYLDIEEDPDVIESRLRDL